MTSDELRTIQEIEDATLGSQPIPASMVKAWMSCASLEVQGALTDLLLEQSRRIQPCLSWPEVCNTFENYYKRSLVENAESEHVPNRYIAGYELVNWFKYLWSEESVPREYLSRLKSMLRELYLENEGMRNAIVNAVLEHLFESVEIQDFFADWKSDQTLAKGYALAKEWGDQHIAATRI